jgi:hypothetical protein
MRTLMRLRSGGVRGGTPLALGTVEPMLGDAAPVRGRLNKPSVTAAVPERPVRRNLNQAGSRLGAHTTTATAVAAEVPVGPAQEPAGSVRAVAEHYIAGGALVRPRVAAVDQVTRSLERGDAGPATSPQDARNIDSARPQQ